MTPKLNVLSNIIFPLHAFYIFAPLKIFQNDLISPRFYRKSDSLNLEVINDEIAFTIAFIRYRTNNQLSKRKDSAIFVSISILLINAIRNIFINHILPCFIISRQSNNKQTLLLCPKGRFHVNKELRGEFFC